MFLMCNLATSLCPCLFSWSVRRVAQSIVKYSLFAVFVIVLERIHRSLRRRRRSERSESVRSESVRSEEECLVVGGAESSESAEEHTNNTDTVHTSGTVSEVVQVKRVLCLCFLLYIHSVRPVGGYSVPPLGASAWIGKAAQLY